MADMTMNDIETWLSVGLSRVILGTVALKTPTLSNRQPPFPALSRLVMRAKG